MRGPGVHAYHIVQGNCTADSAKNSKIADVQFARLKPGQCVLVTPTSTLNVATHFWLDNIYIMQRPGKTPQSNAFVPALITVSAQGKLWATDVTVEGDRVNSQEGLRIEKAAQAFLDGVFLRPSFYWRSTRAYDRSNVQSVNAIRVWGHLHPAECIMHAKCWQ